MERERELDFVGDTVTDYISVTDCCSRVTNATRTTNWRRFLGRENVNKSPTKRGWACACVAGRGDMNAEKLRRRSTLLYEVLLTTSAAI